MAAPQQQAPADPAAIEQRVRTQAQQLGVDPDFAADIAFNESGFREGAVSKAGARGVMQVMPATAKGLSKRYGEDNIAQGVGYLADLGFMFGDVPAEQRNHFVAAAYNAGPSRIMQLMEKAKKAGRDPFNISSLADHLPDETAVYVARLADRLEQRLGQPVAAPVPPEEPTTATTITPVSPRRLQGLTEAVPAALRGTAARGFRRGAEVAEAAEGLLAPGPSPLDALRATGRFLGSASGVLATPFLATPEVVGETLARTTGGVEPETGAMVGGLASAAPALIPGAVRGTARLLSPRLRGAEKAAGKQAVARGEQAAILAGREAQLAERAIAGEQVPQVAAGIEQRLAATPTTTARQLQQLEAHAPTGLVGPTGQRVSTFSEADYARSLKELKTTNAQAAEAARNFDQRVSQRLRNVPSTRIATNLVDDRELAAGLLSHATPEEAAILNRAIEAGKPLSNLPHTETELAALGENMVQGKGIFSGLTHFGLGGAGLGAFGYVMGGAPGTAGVVSTVVLGRLGLRAMDAALASRPSIAAMRGLATIQPGTPDAARALAVAAEELRGPRRLQPKQP